MLLQRLRALDRKVLREDVRRTPEQWHRYVHAWWLPLATAAALAVFAFALDLAALPIAGPLIVLGFQSGRLKAEHDRLESRDPWARIRPLEDR